MAQKSFTTNFLITQGLLIRDEPDWFNTARYCLKRNYLRAFFIFILVTVFQHGSLLAQTRSDNKEPLYLSSTQSSQNTFWKDIDTHWGGRFKTTGTGSQVTDDTIFAPVGTGNYYDGSANLRLINETFLTDAVFFEVDYELIWAGGDIVRKQNELKEIFPNLSGDVFFLGAPLDDDRRLMDLTHTIKEEDSWFLLQRLDRLYLALNRQWGSVRVGRQAVTWGNGFVFNPMDLFNPFPPTAIDRDYKVGDDMINAQFSLSQLGDVQLLYVARRNPDTDEVESDQASLAGKLHFALATTEFDLMGSKHFEDNVVGVGSTGYLGDTAWRLDGTWTFLDDGDDYLSMVANMDYSWVWFEKNFYGFVEYYFNGLGKDDYPDALLDPDITDRLARGELFVLGRNYLSSHIQIELHPLFQVFFTAINNVEDPSGILQPYATWDITQNLQLTGGLSLSYGAKGTEFGGFTLPGTDIRSKSPDNAYLWLIYYF
jgi:hypothetical protein